MALQNIGAANRNDAFYRYKMPKMVSKTEGKGNGIRTNVVNMVDIAKALARPASYTTKYFGCELGAQSKFDEKSGIALVNGAHNTSKLAGLLENFIKKYVQCYGCGNPETEIIITKSRMIILKCAACGFLSDVDMRDKVTSFILKNPPELKKAPKDNKAMRRAEKERVKEGIAADEEQKKLKKEMKKKDPSACSKQATNNRTSKNKSIASDEDHSPPSSQADKNGQVVVTDDDDDDDNVEWQTDTSLEAARQRIQEQLTAVTADMVTISIGEENKKAVKKSSDCRKLVEDMREYLKKGSSPSEFKSILTSLSGSGQDVMDALLVALFEGVGKGFAKEVSKKMNYLIAAATQEEGSQMILLQSIESFCEKASSEAVKEVAFVVKALYDGDVLEEEYILKWYQQPGRGDNNKISKVRKNIKPFIEWLSSAESDSD